MLDSAAILIADDEQSFRESTSRLLLREAFACSSVKNADEAINLLQDKRFDVLIADIRMPHNEDLRIVREAQKIDPQMAILLVTGYPSTKTAIQAVGLPVAAYLTKPLDFEELLEHTKKALKSSKQRRVISATIERLQSVIADLETSQAGQRSSELESNAVPLETIRTLASCLSQLVAFPAKSPNSRETTNLCELLNCEHKSTYRSAVVETVDVLKSTKHLFKSKVLAELRTKLESLLHD